MIMSQFELVSEYTPKGDQPRAIAELVAATEEGRQFQTLMGVTGSGKTFTMACVAEKLQRPTLVISHNKTLAAQLYGEFKGYFPNNAVEYFVSYYDYYQPEAYKPSTDTYIEKEVDLNEEIDRLRLKAMGSLLERRDVIIVATVSCIYGIGSPREYSEQKLDLKVGQLVERDHVLRNLIDIYYNRNDFELQRGSFRVRGDIVEIVPASEDRAVRVEFFGDEIEAISVVDAVTGEVVERRRETALYPAKAYVTDEEKVERACDGILVELEERLLELRTSERLVEAHRLEVRTRYDVEMIRELGYCSGIENYTRYMDGREPGAPPYVLMDYFPADFLLFIDESHVTVPQVKGMWRGDRSRKDMLVEHGFRLPSAYDNRPLVFEEFEEHNRDGSPQIHRRPASNILHTLSKSVFFNCSEVKSAAWFSLQIRMRLPWRPVSGPFHFPNNAEITAHPELVEGPPTGGSTSSPRTGFPEISKNEKALRPVLRPVSPSFAISATALAAP